MSEGLPPQVRDSLASLVLIMGQHITQAFDTAIAEHASKFGWTTLPSDWYIETWASVLEKYVEASRTVNLSSPSTVSSADIEARQKKLEELVSLYKMGEMGAHSRD